MNEKQNFTLIIWRFCFFLLPLPRYICRMEAISLQQLNQKVASVVNEMFAEPVWITAELSDVRVANNGHCYMQLVEKEPKRGTMLAFANAHIWSNRWWLIRDSFLQQTGQAFQSGLKVMLLVEVSMHEAYGYSLNILDVDPTYTLGEMARRRMEILKQLKADGVIDMNRELPFPTQPQRIAIISAEGAAGYGDFCHQLQDNEWGLCFYTHLFPAVMQGSQTEISVISALEHIALYQDIFDVVVIIRGGGASADLASFDSYELALNVANFPLPVITGIGHDRDQTVLDHVAHTSVKTPTAAAALLIDTLSQQLNELQELQDTIIEHTHGRIEKEQLQLHRMINVVRGTHISLGQQFNRLTLMGERIKMLASQRLSSDRQKLSFIEQTVKMAQPDNLLKRGFSITRLNGHAVRSASEVPQGAELQIQTADGTISATSF